MLADVDMMFQFTHPGKGATLSEDRVKRKKLFQFTHPGKGATSEESTRARSDVGFQFTHPGKGATLWLESGSYRRIRFNSRTLGRVRQKPNNHREQLHHVSIHAPWEGCDKRLRIRSLSA